MEAAALSLAKSVVGGLLSNAKSAIVDEAALQLGVQREVAFIKDEFEMMQTFLMAADEEQSNNQVVKAWVKQVRDLAYDAEDCLQLSALHLEKPSWWWWRLPCMWPTRWRIAEEIKKVKARVEDVSQRNLRYRLITKDDSAASKPATAVATARLIDEASSHAARQDESQAVDLLKLISSSDIKALRVVSVWGGSDLARMSVVRESYDDPEMAKNFTCRAWVKVMQPFNLNKFLKSLVMHFHANSIQAHGESTEEAAATEIEIMKMEMIADGQLIHEKFKRSVNEKRYLIVLENLSGIQEWDWIKTYLSDRMNGSRIIVSTQHVEIARLCVEQPDEVIVSRLNKLSFDQPIYLFCKKDFLENGSEVCRSISNANATASDPEQPASSSNTATKIETDGPRPLVQTSKLVTWLEEAHLIGRDKEKDDLIRQILEADQQRRVISVWGMGGIGKTSLVRQVYNSPKLSQKFQSRAWVTVLHPFHPEEFLRALLKQLYSNSLERKEHILGGMVERRLQSMGIDQLISQSEEHLKDKRCLIVLDDLSTIGEWDLIWIKLHLRNKNASRIIVTTREENVAVQCAVECRLANKLEPLTDEAALYLFYKKVFSKEGKDIKISSDMTEQAKLIMKRCGGLPLAITAIGGFLANKPKTTTEWKKLHDHISTELENNPSLGMIKTVLSSSYAGLPYHLKSCFLYLGIFPEDHSIRRKRLVRRWIAEGYTRKKRGMASEEIGEDYFFDLISRSIIQASKVVPSTNGRTKSCHVHDIMREVSISSATEENLISVLDVHGTLNFQDKIRHLVINNTWSREMKALKGLNLSNARSLTVFGEWRMFFISHKMKMLRVLDLEDSLGLVDKDLRQICELRCLRYLGLRGTGIFHLPESLGKLQDLETLDVRQTFVTKLPNSTASLRKLQYLHASPKSYDEVSYHSRHTDEGCLFCIGVCKSPCVEDTLEETTDSTMARLAFIVAKATIWGIDVMGVKVPKGIGKLRCLDTLGVVNIAQGKVVLRNLRKLTQLHKLGVTGITKENSKELCYTLVNLTNLQSLFLRSEDERGLSGHLDCMSCPPKHLQRLKLFCNKLGKLPSWVQSLNNMVKMNLRSTKLNQEAMKVLKQLPNLTILCLLEKSFAGKELHFDDHGFPKLEVLQLDRIGLKLVKFEEKALRKLELLQIKECYSLEDDGCSGLQFLHSLKEILLLGWVRRARLIKNLQNQVDKNTNHPNLKVKLGL